MQIGTAREIPDEVNPEGVRFQYWDGKFWVDSLQIGLRRSVPDPSLPDGLRLEYWTGKAWVDKLLHGSKIKLCPTSAQAAKLELWLRRSRTLWNLLLGMEQAAYSGEPFRPELHWRQIWASVVQENHVIAWNNWDRGKKVRMGPNKGKDIPPRKGPPPVAPAEEIFTKIAGFDARQWAESQARTVAQKEFQEEIFKIAPSKNSKARKAWNKSFKAWTASIKKARKESMPAARGEAINASWEMLRRILPALAAEKSDWYADIFFGLREPGLFIWDSDLLKIMSRLKHEPLVKWIGDAPNGTTQMVCKDLTKAIKTMIEERKKPDGRNTGFPRFKRAGVGSGNSIYFANTEIDIDFGTKGETAQGVKFPKGIGKVKCRTISMPPSSELMGGRVWLQRNCPLYGGRTEDQWWLSVQFKIPIPQPLPPTGQEAGVKVAASILATVYNATQETFEQFEALPEDKRMARSLKLLGRRDARSRQAQEAKQKKLVARKQKQWAYRLEKAEQGSTLEGALPKRNPPKRISRGRRIITAKIARLHVRDAARRKDRWEKISREIAKFDAVTIEKMDVAAMMKKPSKHRRQRAARHKKRAEREGRLNGFKSVRKANRRAAMALGLQRIAVKVREAGKTLTETDRYFDRIRPCNECLTLHEEMRDGRLMLICDTCGKVAERRKNAAINEHEEGSRLRALREVQNA